MPHRMETIVDEDERVGVGHVAADAAEAVGVEELFRRMHRLNLALIMQMVKVRLHAVPVDEVEGAAEDAEELTEEELQRLILGPSACASTTLSLRPISRFLWLLLCMQDLTLSFFLGVLESTEWTSFVLNSNALLKRVSFIFKATQRSNGGSTFQNRHRRRFFAIGTQGSFQT
jgi:hypothetical protein